MLKLLFYKAGLYVNPSGAKWIDLMMFSSQSRKKLVNYHFSPVCHQKLSNCILHLTFMLPMLWKKATF